MGPYLYDVGTGWGKGGPQKADKQNQAMYVTGGGGCQEIKKKLRTSYKYRPYCHLEEVVLDTPYHGVTKAKFERKRNFIMQ